MWYLTVVRTLSRLVLYIPLELGFLWLFDTDWESMKSFAVFLLIFFIGMEISAALISLIFAVWTPGYAWIRRYLSMMQDNIPILPWHADLTSIAVTIGILYAISPGILFPILVTVFSIAESIQRRAHRHAYTRAVLHD